MAQVKSWLNRWGYLLYVLLEVAKIGGGKKGRSSSKDLIQLIGVLTAGYGAWARGASFQAG